MKRKIKLRLSDSTNSYTHFDKKKRYYLFIQYGEESFYFSNKKNAKKWLASFEIKVSDIMRELSSHLSRLYDLNIMLVDYIDFPTLKRMRSSIDFLLDRYWRLFNHSHMFDFSIGREVENMYFNIDSQYEYYRKVIRKNNRFNYQYEKLRQDIKALKRIRIEFESLLNPNVKSIFKNNETNINSEFMLKVI